jgi:hypothetical protein
VRVDVPRWFEIPELVAELESTPIDLLFIDGKHTGDGLYQDFRSFFRFVRPGGVILCDDVHDESYPYAWAGQTLASFHRVTEEFAGDIEGSTIWPFPQLPDWYGQEPIARPFGLVRKRGGGEGSTLPRGETAFVLSELEGLSLEDELMRHLRVFHRRPRLLAELSSFPLSDEEGATFIHGLKDEPVRELLMTLRSLNDEPVRELLTTRPAAVRLLAERVPMAADMDDFQRGPAPSSRGTPALLLFLLRRALGRRLRTRP